MAFVCMHNICRKIGWKLIINKLLCSTENNLKQRMYQYTTRVLSVAFLMFFLLGFGKKTEASHALGGELTYECLGNDQYRVRLAFFRDCDGSVDVEDLDNEITITSSCGNAITLNLQLQSPPDYGAPFNTYLADYEIPIYCEASSCDPNAPSGASSGIQEIVFEGTVTLPPCSDYVFSYAENARSASIVTISTPGTEDVYVEAFLNSVDAPCNSSPQFDLPARGIICVNQENVMIHTATDFDGDSLVYSLYAPLTGPGTPVNYLGVYTFASPVQNNYLTLNTEGEITVFPTEQTITLLGVKVDEYRNGILIGSVMRDMQLSVVQNCPQFASGNFESDTIPGFDVSSEIEICTDDLISFDILLSDTVPGLTYSMTVGNLADFPGATFTTEPDTNNGNSVVGHFEWTPDLNNINSQSVVFQAYDDNCPIAGYTNFTYTFIFKNIVADATTGVIGVGCNDSTLLELVLDGPNGDVTYEWQDGAVTQTYWATPGNYSVSVTDSLGCSGSDDYIVFNNNYPIANITLDPVCLNEPLMPENLSFNYADAGVTPFELTGWSWDFGDAVGTSTDSAASYMYSQPGTYSVTLVVENDNACFDTIEAQVEIHPLPEFNIITNVACIGTVTTFSNSTQIQSGSVTSWNWDFDDLGATSTQQSPSHTFSEISLYDVLLTGTTDQGCVADTTLVANVVDEAVAGFSYEALPDCGKENLQIYFTNESERATTYLWDFENNVTDTATNPVYDTPTSTGPLTTLVAYAYPNEAACSDTAVIDITELFLTIDFDTINAGNVITPNGDGFNDCLSPFWDESYEECYRLRIWDRWGMFIYDSDDVNDGYCWPGTDRNGQSVSGGTFFFVAEVNSYSRSGSVYVIP
jgi:gliding motility-associated-like protein